MKKLTLKKEMKSAKFGLRFPARVELNAWVDADGRIYAKHSSSSSISIRVPKSNISLSNF